MAWIESYHCDVCGVSKNEDDPDWWLASFESICPIPGVPEQPEMRLTPWNGLLSHGPGVRHLCGARCAQTELDRWMTPIRESLRSAAETAAARNHNKAVSKI
jgi:hypothetical protein